MDYSVKLLLSEFVTHDVKRFMVSRPEGFEYRTGQGVELAVDEPGWREQGRPFTPTSLPDAPVLEFIIKAYPAHHGVTARLHTIAAGTGLRMSAPFGTINYQGPGTFIAGGAGITPFMAILRELASEGRLEGHSLLFSNKTPADIICMQELQHYLGPRGRFLCTRKSDCNCPEGRIDKAFLERQIGDFGQKFYVCGPPAFVELVNGALRELGADPLALIFEQ
ncbi:MAG: FAD-binding oxidoreductase [Gammaproteobacteria bacterium]|nr:FAD-binding oxidoreductase [Gammaproteobacteria bacterium]